MHIRINLAIGNIVAGAIQTRLVLINKDATHRPARHGFQAQGPRATKRIQNKRTVQIKFNIGFRGIEESPGGQNIKHRLAHPVAGRAHGIPLWHDQIASAINP
jgi:hypothetical protein